MHPGSEAMPWFGQILARRLAMYAVRLKGRKVLQSLLARPSEQPGTRLC